ncbi:MAG: SRPBCC family protein, partial [Deltaproteobacteria bacterium]|nr:SRPBCC family protein [Deltaproteobacteria bacterium]
MIRRMLVLSLFLFTLSVATSAFGGKKEVKLTPIVGRLDLKPLVPMLNKGEVTLVESYRSGKLRQVTIVGLVKATPTKVWDVLTDYEHYLKFMPSLVEVEITKKQGADTIITYELEVPGVNMDYSLRHHNLPKSRIDISLADDEGDITTGAWRWDLVPHENGTQTMLIYSLYTDVSESS